MKSSCRLFIPLILLAILWACAAPVQQPVPLAPEPAAYLQGVEDFRAAKDAYFKTGSSPLSSSARKNFSGLNYFPIDQALRIVGSLDKYPKPQLRAPGDGSSGTVTMNAVGQFRFDLDGQGLEVEVWQPAGNPALMVLFKDASNGVETYEAGRYIELDATENGLYVLDFNRAYNPFCHYSDKHLCPFPPSQNMLKMRIPAGEKKYGQH